MASEAYSWSCHLAAVAALLRLPVRNRKRLLQCFDRLAGNPFVEPAERFEIPGHAPFYVVTEGERVFTFQVDHAVKLVRILEIE